MVGARKSTTCYGKHTKKPVTEYDTLQDATNGALHAKQRFGTGDMLPYLCSLCRKWHVSPMSRNTVSVPSDVVCGCLDSNGQPKQAYLDRNGASQRARILQQERRGTLSVYQCPTNGRVWHLTHTTAEAELSVPAKSLTCRGKSSGLPLTEYSSRENAQNGANHIFQKHYRGGAVSKMVPYRCEECNQWHLSRTDDASQRPDGSGKPRRTPSTPAKSRTCFGKQTGRPLTEYGTIQEAQNGSNHVLAQYGTAMNPYSCTKCSKWHLAPIT